MGFLRVTSLLLLLYLALTLNVQLNNILVGLVVSGIVTALIRGRMSPIKWRRIPSVLWAGTRYVALVLTDVIKGGVTVARIVLDPKLPIRSGIVAIPSGCSSEVATALSAHAMTVSPGEMVVAIGHDGMLYTHCLDATKAAEYAEDAQRLRRKLLSKIIL